MNLQQECVHHVFICVFSKDHMHCFIGLNSAIAFFKSKSEKISAFESDCIKEFIVCRRESGIFVLINRLKYV